MKRVGLHIRMAKTFLDVMFKACEYKLPVFQSFLMNEMRRYPRIVTRELQHFVSLRRAHFDTLFVHGSYWVNLCSAGNTGYETLKKELMLAKRLEFTHIILHPGTARGCIDHIQGIDLLAHSLNRVLKNEHDIIIVLENTTHGGWTVGSDLYDFHLLLTKLDYPDKVQFCIDTAHAHAFGYDISNDNQQDDFLATIDAMIGFSRVGLIHLNDTHELCGSKIDRHCVLGNGNIGEHALRRFVTRPIFNDIPVIMELPPMAAQNEQAMVAMVNQWLDQPVNKQKESQICV